MITNISGGFGVVVQGGNANAVYLNSSSPNSPSSGECRYNNGQVEVYDGNCWCSISSSHTSISLDSSMIEVVEWARKKMQEEKELEELAKQYPILEDAMRDLQVIKVLVSGKRNHDIQQS